MPTIELKTGSSRPARREDYITKMSGTWLDENLPIPIWLAFLDRVTGGDKDLEAYLQRVTGYCMTGETLEHALFFLYGTGANGKGVFTSSLVGIWGDYAAIAPMETFIESNTDRHPTELAKLWGARLVVAQETSQGRRWDEAKIKGLTGGDKISARFMRQDFFEYVPQFKLMIAGNHKPALTSVDEAIRRRIHLIPFGVTIPKGERDLNLFEKLKAEWPGILAWVIRGCLEWQKIGLAPPAVVTAATEEYLTEEDSFGQWVGECCITDKEMWGAGDALWASWKDWATCANERPGSRKAFAEEMKNHGFEPAKSQHTRGYNGIALRGSLRLTGEQKGKKALDDLDAPDSFAS